MKENDIDLSMIIACYNEAETIEDTLPRVRNFLDLIESKYELIIIDDKSKDNTVSLVRSLIKEYSNVTLIAHERNSGRGAVIKEGIRLAKGKNVGFLDIDLEVPEHYILPCLMLLKKADMVIVNRLYYFSFETLLRWITTNGYTLLMRWFIHLKYKDTEGGYKFFNREKILPVLALTENDHWFWDTEIVAMSHFTKLRIAELPVVFMRRRGKTSTVKLFSDSWKQFKALLNFRKQLKRLGYI